ncbi:MAG: epoxyqueuosine reductase [Spirochaetales bacterium]|nr:epoxyqueuosine reductase [Spirochaetales bacterium]
MVSTDELRILADSMGADFFGVADLSVAQHVILAQGGKEVAQYPRAVSIGLKLPNAVVDQLPQRDESPVAKLYKHHAYDVINQRLDQITSRICGFLESRGNRSFPVPAAQTVDETRLVGIFSNKMAAHLAGLGWIGKSCLLVTPEAGPRVRWATVLTHAVLEKTGDPMEERCGECAECVDICPVHAFTGRPFRAEEQRELRFEAHKCKGYLNELTETMGLGVCGMCLFVCPHGKRASESLA